MAPSSSGALKLRPCDLLRNPHNDSVLSVRHRVLSAIGPNDEDERDAIAAVNALLTSGDLVSAPEAQPTIATCRVCGCTEEFACDRGCEWVEPGLCTSCAGPRR